MRIWPTTVAVAAVLVLEGCSAHYREKPKLRPPRPVPPVAAVKAPPVRPDFYVVRTGETLPSIALRFGLNVQSLAEWNGIAPPYAVNAGRTLQFFQPKMMVKPEPPARPATGNREKRRNGPQKKSTISIDNGNILKLYWQWPLKGSILKNYAAEDNKGIDIAGDVGQTVRAAAPGKVVYSGDALAGYGHLLIIKHDDTWLSAYAYNSKLLVAEGDEVSAGQAIAEVGSSGERACLHFEIRKNGNPVNPAEYLPEK